jgi:hypothetical protein
MWGGGRAVALTRYIAGFCSLTCLALLGLSLMCLEDVRSHMRTRPSTAYSHLADGKTGISRTLPESVSSSVLCERIELPFEFFNSSTGPYNPGAVRHPGTGEWVLVFTYDEARPAAPWAESGQQQAGGGAGRAACAHGARMSARLTRAARTADTAVAARAGAAPGQQPGPGPRPAGSRGAAAASPARGRGGHR